MKKLFYLFLTIALFACTSQPNNQAETNTHQTTDNSQTKNLPPKPENYSWFFEMCDYSGTFDANKYSKTQLDNTLEYLLNGKGTLTNYSIYDVKSLEKIDKKAIEHDYNQRLEELKSLEYINTPFFDQLKQQRINEIERVKLLSIMHIEQFENPEVLLNDTYSANQCKEYTTPLVQGGNELLVLRKKMAEQSRDEGNSNAWERYTNETKSDDPILAARVFVSTFGWWNCVNNSIKRPNASQIHEENFLKLFEDVAKECEMP